MSLSAARDRIFESLFFLATMNIMLFKFLFRLDLNCKYCYVHLVLFHM